MQKKVAEQTIEMRSVFKASDRFLKADDPNHIKRTMQDKSYCLPME